MFKGTGNLRKFENISGTKSVKLDKKFKHDFVFPKNV